MQILEGFDKRGKIPHHGQNGVEGERSLKTVKATVQDVDLVASRSCHQDVDPADGDVTSSKVSIIIGESLAERESEHDEVENTDEWYCSIQ